MQCVVVTFIPALLTLEKKPFIGWNPSSANTFPFPLELRDILCFELYLLRLALRLRLRE